MVDLAGGQLDQMQVPEMGRVELADGYTDCHAGHYMVDMTISQSDYKIFRFV